jgi:hypothetical protein
MMKIAGSGVRTQDPNPLIRGMDPRIWIRIHTKMSWIRNTGSVSYLLEPNGAATFYHVRYRLVIFRAMEPYTAASPQPTSQSRISLVIFVCIRCAKL